MQSELIDKNPLLRHSFQFSLNIISYCESLEVRHRYTLARQLFRAGTSIGANAFEAQNAESKADFIHKIKIAAKEADETQYWLLLCRESTKYPDCDTLLSSLEEIHKILNSIIKTARKNNPLRFFLVSMGLWLAFIPLHK